MISFDLDMTLLDHRTDQITPSALEAIEKLRPKYKIVLATGRDMDNYYSTSYRDIVRPDAIVHMNGTKITVGDKLLFEHIFDPELLRRVLSFCDEKGFGIGMTVGDEDYYIHPEIIAANDIRFCILNHRPEFTDLKLFSTLGQPRLLIKHWSPVGQVDRQRHQQKKWR